MSNRALNAVWQHSEARGNTRLVLLSIADQADDHGWAWPSHENIQARTLIARRTVQRQIQNLHDTGEIAIVERVGTSNLYRVLVGDLAEGNHPAPTHLVAHLEEINERRHRGANLTPPAPESGSRQTDEEGRQFDTPPRHSSDAPPRAIAVTPDPSLIPNEPPEEPLAETADEEPRTAGEIVAEIFGAPCAKNGCDRGFEHPGPHRDPWFEAVAVALRQPIGDKDNSRAGRIARHAEDAGHPPDEIIRRAGVIVANWGQAKLTLNSLWEHYDWAGSPLRDVTEGQITAYVAEAKRTDRIAAAEAAASRGALGSGHEREESA